MTYRAPAWTTLVAVAVLALAASTLLVLGRPVEMTVDGVRVESDVPPVTTINHRIFVPVRSFAEALGAQTLSDGDGRIDLIRGNQSLRLRLGDVHAVFNGMPLTLQHAPFLVRGRMMVEMHALAVAFDVRARYDARTARIDVQTPGIGQAPIPSPSNSSTQ